VARALDLLTFGALALGCAQVVGCATVQRRKIERAPIPRAQPEPARALASGCRAEPSTAYGDEPVVFEIQGQGSSAPVALELRDERGQVVQQGQAPLPGQWRPAALASGDFRLAVARSGVSCTVTVNRELSRATEPAR